VITFAFVIRRIVKLIFTLDECKYVFRLVTSLDTTSNMLAIIILTSSASKLSALIIFSAACQADEQAQTDRRRDRQSENIIIIIMKIS